MLTSIGSSAGLYEKQLQDFSPLGQSGFAARLTLTKLGNLYRIDLMCDADRMPFYEPRGFQRYTGMIMRNYDRQVCT